MKKIIILLSLLMLSGCIFQSDEGTGTGSTYVMNLRETPSIIKNTAEFEECMGPSVRMCVSQVTNQLARERKSPALCEELPDQNAIDACKYGVVMSQTIGNTQLAICEELLGTYRTECRITLIVQEAITTGDLAQCDRLRTEVEDKNTGELPRGSADRIEQCKLDTLMKKSDVRAEDCDLIVGTAQKQICQAILENRTNQENTPNE